MDHIRNFATQTSSETQQQKAPPKENLVIGRPSESLLPK